MNVSHETPKKDVVVPKTARVRDAVASKESLLRAAQELFGQRGFERTTIRDIGERAGVDAALIARYFGSKSDLYFAAVAAEDAREEHPGGSKACDRWRTPRCPKLTATGPGRLCRRSCGSMRPTKSGAPHYKESGGDSSSRWKST